MRLELPLDSSVTPSGELSWQTGGRKRETVRCGYKESKIEGRKERNRECVLTPRTPTESKWISQHTIDPDTVTPILYLSPFQLPLPVSPSCAPSLSDSNSSRVFPPLSLSLSLVPSLVQTVSHSYGAPGYNQITDREMECIRNWHAVQFMCACEHALLPNVLRKMERSSRGSILDRSGFRVWD